MVGSMGNARAGSRSDGGAGDAAREHHLLPVGHIGATAEKKHSK